MLKNFDFFRVPFHKSNVGPLRRCCATGGRPRQIKWTVLQLAKSGDYRNSQLESRRTFKEVLMLVRRRYCEIPAEAQMAASSCNTKEIYRVLD